MADNQLSKMLGAIKLNTTLQAIYTASNTGQGKQMTGNLNLTCLDLANPRYVDIVINDGSNDYFYAENLPVTRGGTDIIPITVADGQSIQLRAKSIPTQMTISSATQANPIVVVVNDTASLNSSSIIDIASVTGMTQINGRFRASIVSGTTFSLQDLSGANVDGTGFTAYTSGGTADAQVVDATLFGYEETIPSE